MHNPTDRIAHTMAFVVLVVEHWLEQEIAQISTMKDRSDDLSHHERSLLPWSYISLRFWSGFRVKDWIMVVMRFRFRVRFPLSIQWRGTGRCFFLNGEGVGHRPNFMKPLL